MQSASARSGPRGTLHVWPNGALLVGADMVNEPHRHFPASVSFALEGSFRVRTELDQDWRCHPGVMVAPNVEQQMDGTGATIVNLQIDAETNDYARIAHHFEQRGPVHALPDELAEQLGNEARTVLSRGGMAIEIWELAINLLAAPGEPVRTIDPRISQVLSIIKQDFLSPPAAAALAERVNLSEGRLIHLFSEQMGLPVRRYVLWLRLRDVVYSLATGYTLTEAAHQAGFSDSAHLSRTFRGMFGVPPSVFVESRGRVRLAFDLLTAQEQEGPHREYDAERLARAIKARSERER